MAIRQKPRALSRYYIVTGRKHLCHSRLQTTAVQLNSENTKTKAVFNTCWPAVTYLPQVSSRKLTLTTTLENYVSSDYCFVRYSLLEIKTKHNQYLMEKTGRGQLIRLSTEKSIQTKKIQKGVLHSRQKKILSQMQH